MTTNAPNEPKLQAALRAPIGPEFLREDTVVNDEGGWYRLRTPSAPWPAVNEVVLSALSVEDPDPMIDSVIAEYRADDLPLKWCVYPWSQPKDLGERLLRRGAIHWQARGMVCNTDMEIALPDNASVEPIGLPTLDVYIRAMVEGWGLPPPEEGFMRERLTALLTRTPAPVQLFVVRSDGQVAGSAATVLREGAGYLMGANVLPDFRGRGLYRALLEGRLAALRRTDVPLATTQAREHTSAPMLEHIGFETVFRFELYQLNPLDVSFGA